MALSVKAFMSGDPAAIYAKASAFDRMVDREIRHLPVIDEEHRAVVDPAPFD